MKNYNRNVKLNYLYTVVSYFDLKSAIWVLFLMSRGLNLLEIGLLESIYHLTAVLLEVPTGMVADLLGRKKTILLGSILSTISALVMLLSHSFTGYALSFIIQAFGGALRSGSVDALVYDSLKELDEEDRYLSINSKVNVLIELAQGLSVLLGGVLADLSFSLVYVIAFLVGSLACFVVLFFCEPRSLEISRDEKVSLRHHVKETVNALIKTKLLQGRLVFFPLILTMSTINYFYIQSFLEQLGLSYSEIGFVYAINTGVSVLGGLAVTTVSRVLGAKAYLIISLGICGGLVLFLIPSLSGALVGFYLINFLTTMLYPISSEYIQSRVKSEQRATILSCDAFCFSLLMMVLFPAIGWLSGMISLRYCFALCGSIGLLSVVMMWQYDKVDCN